MKRQKTDVVQDIDLTIFDEGLSAMANNGAFYSDMEECLGRLLSQIEPEELTDSELDHFYQTVKNASVENAIIEARRKTPVSSLPLGRFIQLVRDRSRLSQGQIAGILEKDVSYVEKIENGMINPLNLVASEIVDIMQVFCLTITDVVKTIEAYLSTRKAKRCKISGMARSSVKVGSTDRGERLAHAMDVTLRAIDKKKGSDLFDTKKVDRDYINELEKELKKRKAENLLI